MKKLGKKVTAALLLLLSISFAACGTKEPAAPETPETPSTIGEGLFTPGTYEGTAKGYHGDITLTVTVDENNILEIKSEHTETEGLGDKAVATLTEAALEKASLSMDLVSGATYSSQGFLAALEAALVKAGADVEKLKIKETVEVEKKDQEFDTEVAIIGGGGAGLAAAVSAHQNGAKVLLVEKMPNVGGNTIISGSAFNAVDPKRQSEQGIEDSVEKHFQQTYEGGDKQGDPELVRVLVENAYPTIEWLESLGMKFTDKVFTVLGALWPRSHKPVEPLGTGYVNTFMNYINEHKDDITVLTEVEAKELLVNADGAVTGFLAEGKNGKITVNAKNGVIVATGGFGANVEMRDQYNTIWPKLTNIKTTNHRGATGDGIIMAEKVNASIVQMENIQLLPMGDPVTGSLSGNIEQGVENRIFVNAEGNRFVDEGARRDVMTKALMEQSDSMMWVIVDQHSYPTGDTVNNFNETIDSLVKEGRAYKADTLEDLAKQIGVEPENLVKAVEAFNASVDGAKDAFGRTLFMDKLDTAPFYAGKRVPTVHHTMGGIKITPETRVVDQNGEIIKGLFAAGEVTGGIHGANRLGGNALADVHTFGRIAGATAASEGK
ncbi:flavocytochrome c [Proteiniclasticum ruminis]|uniref:Urocanate reductase n=1 Tax=Proteiniclasticum ruminis TaxID=398199 RepID=A0A1G8GZ35_9CLOT|nr:flavocytochrome c [Proteiniclasticum ruminis]SDH99617.1 fumarate reductase flavoprotein subunit [Proteiniclasticum ruminis]